MGQGILFMDQIWTIYHRNELPCTIHGGVLLGTFVNCQKFLECQFVMSGLFCTQSFMLWHLALPSISVFLSWRDQAWSL